MCGFVAGGACGYEGGIGASESGFRGYVMTIIIFQSNQKVACSFTMIVEVLNRV